MKEIPILFSTPMVEAILPYRKRMTRRTRGLEEINKDPDSWAISGTYHILTENYFEAVFEHKITKELIGAKCPYGLPSDVLWVRETFCPMVISDFDGEGNDKHTYLFKTEPDSNSILNQMEDATWKPSIHMPKVACRIWLQVEEIRVERLQEITEDDAIAEGVNNEMNIPWKTGDDTYVGMFGELWEHINGPESWDLNPWVWVVKFKVLSTTGKPKFI